jgi:predicted N-formylglutamate amidohydrolase
LELAQALARHLRVPLFSCEITRLLVEPNRSIGHPRLFSEFSRHLDAAAKQELLQGYYYEHRNRAEAWIEQHMAQGRPVIHLSVHTFTPVLDGQSRTADVGLLYDPRQAAEKVFVRRWQDTLKQHRPDLIVRRNYPYLGKSDGFTSYLRGRFPGDDYLGIELEVNQRWPSLTGKKWSQLRLDLAQTLLSAIRSIS